MEKKVAIKDKIKGGIIGLLVGDALGVPYEFHAAQEIPPLDEIEFEPPASFHRAHAGVPIGTYSDDGAQALILLASLLECGKFDVEHFAKGLVDWYDHGYMAVGGKVFDVGIQTANAIRELKSGVRPHLAGGFDEYSNGNGSLMRVLPLALWHQGSDKELIADAFAQSAVTHAHPRSKICCALYCLWARRILQNLENEWDSAINTFNEIFPLGSSQNIELITRIFPENSEYDIKGSGYVVDSLRAAIWLNQTFNSYEIIVKKSVELGNDTDTTACIAGGIAGLRFGFEEIPQRWTENLNGLDIIEPLIEKFLLRFD